MRIRLLLFMLGAGAIMLLPSAGHAGTCNITAVAPAAGAAVRGTTSVAWTWSGGCNHHVPANTVTVTVNRPAVAGGGTVSLGTATFPATSVSWPTTNGSFGDGAGYSLTLSIGGPSSGNAETIVGLAVDNTAPVLGVEQRSPQPNGSGWNSSDVTVTWPCTDATSGVNATASSLSVTKTAEGANQSAAATCVDRAGNSASATVSGINIDKTAPSIALESRTPANASGWNNGDVTVAWRCTDALSGVVAANVSSTVSGEGANQSVSGTCADVAGNTAGNTVTGINIDFTAPAIALDSRLPAANAAGWNSGDVTVTWSCSDALAGVEAASVDQAVTGEGAALSATGTCTDLAGNTRSDTQSGINIDATAPELSLASRTPANANGWNNGAVSLVWQCTDALSGVDAAASSLAATVAADGQNQSASANCADLAGNAANDDVNDINIDTAAPSISLSSRTPANAAGWNAGMVTVEWDCTDALSGVDAASVSTTVTDDGAGQSADGACTDLAGNETTDEVGDINIDTAAPSISLSSRTPANGNGWNAGDVTVEWGCADALSGVDAASVDATVSGEGAGQSASGECADLAGNTASDTVEDINIDETSPVIAFASRTPANGNGWNNGDVTVAWDCSDALSGVVAAGVSSTVSGEGADQSASGECADLAGNTAGDTVEDINIDLTAPAIAFASRTAANGNGWNNGDVTVAWDCSDALSGVAAESVSSTVSSEGADQSASGECADLAGNAAGDTVEDINVDLTAPSITLSSRTPGNGNGWNNGDVTVEWDCADALSGVVAASVSSTVSSEGADQSASGECADLAGNAAGDTVEGINVDLTAPEIVFASRTPGNGNGWNNGDVTVEWDCADALSGVVAASVSSTVSSEGADQSASGECADLAGNTAGNSHGGIAIDLTAPDITFVSRTAANANGWNAGDVTVEWLCTDTLSGVESAGESQTVSTDGADQSATGTCTDLAGSTAQDSVDGINIDTAAPSIELASRTPANADGWNNTAVEIVWDCSDDLSGVEAATDSATLTLEGAGQSASGECADLAGNTAGATESDINIDTTAPSAAIGDSLIYIRLLGNTMTLTGVDTLSGVKSMSVTFTGLLGGSQMIDAVCIAGCGTTSATFEVDLNALDGAGLFTAEATATDYAGNTGDASPAVTAVIV